MALLNRLFPTKRKSHKQGYVPFGRNDYSSWKPFNFTREQVRLLLFRECDARGRKLLFDSSAVQKTRIECNQNSRMKLGLKSKCDASKKTETYVEITNGFGYQYIKPSSDVTIMGEMIFGSVAMTYKGMTCKIHSIKSPDRLMCSRVFHAPAVHFNCKRRSDQSIDSSGSSISSINDSMFSQSGTYEIKLGSSSGSGPLDVPVSETRSKVPSSSLEGDSGFCGDASLRSISSSGSGIWSPYPYNFDSQNVSYSTVSNSNSPGGSLASLQRRWLRNMSTSLEFGLASSHWHFKGKNAVPSDETFCRPHRKTQLGLTVVISLTPEEEKDMDTFFFEHIAIIESILERLQCNIEKAYTKKEVFVHSMMDAFQELQQWLCDLFTAPRLSTPVWIGLVSTSDFYRESSRYRYNIASTFLRDFCQLIASIDTKATNFFISTLVTAVLTHHLGWVTTILPAKAPPSSVTKPPYTVQILHALAKSHPYNALWAQLGDLHGAVGNPVKIARTIVTANGKKSDLLNKLLYCLSYFIRCGNIERRIDNHMVLENDINMVDSVIESLSSTSLNSSTASSSTIVPDDPLDMERQEKELLISDSSSINNCQKPPSSIMTNPILEDTTLTKNHVTNSSSTSIFHTKLGLRRSPTQVSNLSYSSDEKSCERNPREPSQNSYLHPDVISDKVSRLCRVPTNAVLYHMKPNIPDVKNLIPQKIDCEKQLSSVQSTGKKGKNIVSIDSSKLTASVCKEAVVKEKHSEGSVIFVLGDNEELVGLKGQNGFSITKSKSDNTLSGETLCSVNNNDESTLGGLKHVSKSSCTLPMSSLLSENKQVKKGKRTSIKMSENICSKFEVDSNVHSDKYFFNCEDTGLDSGIVLEEETVTKCDNSSNKCVCDDDSLWKNERTKKSICKSSVVIGSSSLVNDVNGNPRLSVDDCESKVVTSHSFVIELEDVHGDTGTKIPIVAKKLPKQVSRSHSLSFPDTKTASAVRTVTICRRHSENIHLNERYLRDYHSVRFNFERCEGVLSDYVDEIGVEKSPLNEKKSKKLFDARGNFELQEKICDRCKHAEQGLALNSVLCGGDACICISNMEVPKDYSYHRKSCLQSDSEKREGNALFDDYGLLSDEELQSSTEIQTGTEKSSSEQEKVRTPLLVELPLPRYSYSQREQMSGFAASLLGGVSDHYMPDMVLHGCTQILPQWEATLKSDLSISAHHPMLDQDVSEAVCIVANADLWEVQLVSSQVSVTDKPGGFGIHIGMSQLVANMLESLLHLWKLRTPPEQCLQHLESKLRELCLRSQALAELLLTTEFCDLATLTTSLGLEANDVPLLFAIASTHSPQVTNHYGLSFQ